MAAPRDLPVNGRPAEKESPPRSEATITWDDRRAPPPSPPTIGRPAALRPLLRGPGDLTRPRRCQPEAMQTTRTPVVFIHGMWLHATCWTPWLELFRAAGYDPIAPGWPGEPDTVAEAREHPELVANATIDDVVAHYTKIIDSLDARPI